MRNKSSRLPHGWRIERVGNLCEVGRGSSPRPIMDSVYFEGGTIPWVKIADATRSGKYLYETKEKVNDYGASFSRLLLKGSLIVAASGTLGYTQILGVDGCIHDGWLYLTGFKKLDKDFMYYYLQSRKDHFYTIAYGAAIQNINTTVLREMEIALPPLHVQRKIGGILSAYDDLIENNFRRIEILEEMVQAIYREWFVHFRFPGHEKVKIVDSSLGKIPDGWAVVSIKDVYDTRSGGTPSRKNNEYYVGGTINWVKTKELNERFIWDTEEKITELGLKQSSAKVLPPKTVLMAMYGANIGQLGILGNQASTNQACCAFLTHGNRYGYVYLYLFLRDHRDSIVNLRQGAAQQNVSQEILRDLPIVKPPVELVGQFTEVVEPFFDLIEALQRENANLRTSRDLLLPKLISGEVEVTDLNIGGGNAFT